MSKMGRLIVKYGESAVRLGDDQVIPASFSVFVDDQDATTPSISAEFEVLDGVPQCRGLRILSGEGAREVRANDYRRVSVEDLLEEALAGIATPYPDSSSADPTEWEPTNSAEGRKTVRQVRIVRKESRRRITDAVLREVADVYRAHLDGNPTEAVAARFGKSHRTAALYVQQSRAAGHLGAAIKGKAGER